MKEFKQKELVNSLIDKLIGFISLKFFIFSHLSHYVTIYLLLILFFVPNLHNFIFSIIYPQITNPIFYAKPIFQVSTCSYFI